MTHFNRLAIVISPITIVNTWLISRMLHQQLLFVIIINLSDFVLVNLIMKYEFLLNGFFFSYMQIFWTRWRFWRLLKLRSIDWLQSFWVDYTFLYPVYCEKSSGNLILVALDRWNLKNNIQILSKSCPEYSQRREKV